MDFIFKLYLIHMWLSLKENNVTKRCTVRESRTESNLEQLQLLCLIHIK